jgi:hypothetical protein
MDEDIKRLQLKQLIDYYANGNKSEFARKIGITPQGLSSWIMRGSFDLEIIYSKCENLSADWLFTGKGRMIKSNDVTEREEMIKSSAHSQPCTIDSVHANLVQALADANKALAAANDTISNQQKMIANIINTNSYPPPRNLDAQPILNPVDKK